MVKYITKILPWKDQGIPCFDFNIMKTTPQSETRRLAETLGKNFTDSEIKDIVFNSFGKKTQTLSQKKDRTIYWSNEAHQKIDALVEKYKIRYVP